jgi:hypothetical protein
LTPANPVLQYPQSSALLDNITQQGITMTPEIESLFKRLSETRTKVVTDIMEKEGCNYMTAAIRYDGELAPPTTDRQKFALIGFHLPVDFVPQNEAEAIHFNERAMAAYAMWGDQVVGYEHLSPMRLSAVLQALMEDPVRMIPPTKDCTQYIDLSLAKP